MYGELFSRMKALPLDRRMMLVVRSMPFGDIIEDDTRVCHGHVGPIDGEDKRQWVAYGLCAAAKGNTAYEEALRSAGFLE